jgi:hypothetical protein
MDSKGGASFLISREWYLPPSKGLANPAKRSESL